MDFQSIALPSELQHRWVLGLQRYIKMAKSQKFFFSFGEFLQNMPIIIIIA